jgi:hypothetical protein
MKKYLIASMVAVMAFAFAAFAASLDVTADRLAAGTDNVACAENADVSWTTSNDDQGHWVMGFDIAFSDTSCDGEYVNVAIFDAPAGIPNVRPQQVANIIPDTTITDGELSYTLPNEYHGKLRVEDVEQVQVLVGEDGSKAPFTYVR